MSHPPRRRLGILLRRLFGQPPSAPAPTPPPSTALRDTVEHLVGSEVGDLALYERALAHRSVLRGLPESHLASNERLEFLGDAVLGFITAEHLYHHFPDQDEGFLTRLRAKLVNGQALARCAEQINLGPLIRMSENMEQSAGRRNVTILADAYEAVIGAVYLDLGLEAARCFVQRTMLEAIDLASLAARRDNFKSLLLEYVQGLAWPQPQYRVLQEEGPSHERLFTVEVLLMGKPYGRGTANSKKKAEQQAANEALQRLRHEGARDL